MFGKTNSGIYAGDYMSGYVPLNKRDIRLPPRASRARIYVTSTGIPNSDPGLSGHITQHSNEYKLLCVCDVVVCAVVKSRLTTCKIYRRSRSIRRFARDLHNRRIIRSQILADIYTEYLLFRIAFCRRYYVTARFFFFHPPLLQMEVPAVYYTRNVSI